MYLSIFIMSQFLLAPLLAAISVLGSIFWFEVNSDLLDSWSATPMTEEVITTDSTLPDEMEAGVDLFALINTALTEDSQDWEEATNNQKDPLTLLLQENDEDNIEATNEAEEAEAPDQWNALEALPIVQPEILKGLESMLWANHKITKFNGDEHEVHAYISWERIIIPYHPSDEAVNTARCFVDEGDTTWFTTSDEADVKVHPLLQTKELSLGQNGRIYAYVQAYDGVSLVLNVQIETDEWTLCFDIWQEELLDDDVELVYTFDTEPGCPAWYAYNKDIFASCPSIDELYEKVAELSDWRLTKMVRGLGIILK